MFGDNLFISLKYGFSDAGFNLTPMDDRDFVNTPFWDQTNSIFESKAGVVGEWRYYVERPVSQYNFLLNYFNDNLLGASHDIKLGVEYADRNQYSESVYAGNMQVNWNYNSPTMDFSTPLDGTQDTPADDDFYRFMFWRGNYTDYGVKAIAAYFSDTITFGRFNLLLGVRYDYQRPSINPVTRLAVTDNPAWDVADAAVKTAMDTMLPGIDIPETAAINDNGDAWYYRFLSPRLGLTWDVTGDGKTIAKLSVAAYGDFMGTGSYNQMPGGYGGWMDFWWWDNSPDTGRAADGVVQLDELYWHQIGGATPYAPVQLFPANTYASPADAVWDNSEFSFWGGYDRTAPGTLRDPYGSNDPSRNSNRTLEAMLTVEREIMTDFSVAVNATYRRYDKMNWSLDYFLDGTTRVDWESQDWYGIENTLPADVVDGIAEYLPAGYDKWDGDWKDALDHSWYTMIDNTANGNNPSQGTNYYMTTKMPDDRYNDYFGIDVIFTKRLSNKWMLNANMTWQAQHYRYGDEGYINPTNIWAFEGQPVSAYMGGASGKISQYVFSRWLVKASGLYQLPYDFNVSFTFTAREGWIIRERAYIRDYTITNSRSRSSWLYLTPFGTDRLNTFWRFDFRLEKMIKAGETGRIYIMADLFNVFNSKLENRRYQKDWGNFYYYGAGDPNNYFRETTNAYTLNEILNPRVVRLGVRFQF